MTAIEHGASAYPGISPWRAGLADALAWLDWRTAAAAILDRAEADRFGHVSPDPNRPVALALYADAAALMNHTPAAAILYELTEPWAEQLLSRERHRGFWPRAPLSGCACRLSP